MLVGSSLRISVFFVEELFWEVGDGDRWLIVSAQVGENRRILREIDEYLRVLSCWDSTSVLSAQSIGWYE